jgi:hypothetical protein
MALIRSGCTPLRVHPDLIRNEWTGLDSSSGQLPDVTLSWIFRVTNSGTLVSTWWNPSRMTHGDVRD